MIDRDHKLPLARQAKAVGISRGSIYYRPRSVGEAGLGLMRRIDELHLEYPFAGSRMMRGLLSQEGLSCGRRHIATLMRRMGIEALYRKPNTSRRRPGHTVYPYLLRGLEVSGLTEHCRSRPVKWCKSASSCCCCLGGCRLREIGLRKSFVAGQNGGCEVSTSDDPFVVLLSQDGANEAAHGRPVREDAHHIGASPDLLVETLLWVVGPELLPVGEWEAGEGQDVGSRFVQ